MNNKKPIDYYDRIADALQIISGDDSHTSDESPTMDYYDRIANALEEIASDGNILVNSSFSIGTVTTGAAGTPHSTMNQTRTPLVLMAFILTAGLLREE